MLDTLDAAAVRDWCARGLAVLVDHQDEIDALNVYPVPDGDTGTNLVLTLRSVAAELGQSDTAAGPPLAGTMRAVARGALTGARGNSGVILSQLLRGLGEVIGPLPAVRGRELADGLARAADVAYSAVARPTEGTILSVARAAADAARRAVTGPAGANTEPAAVGGPAVLGEPAARVGELGAVVRAARAGAWAALRRTPDQLAVLAGAVDAGGQGLCLLLDALDAVVSGAAPTPPPEADLATAHPPAADRATADDAGPDLVAADAAAGRSVRAEPSEGSAGYSAGYEVQYLLAADQPAVEKLRVALDPLGDSLVVVGGDGLYNVHVHVPVEQIGPAVEAGIDAGRPTNITVTRFADHPSTADRKQAPTGRALLAILDGDGLAELLRGEGVLVVPAADATVDTLLEAIDTAGAREVVLLPGDADTHDLARAAARAATGADPRRAVAVVPCRSPVQALAAVAVRDEAAGFTEDVATMVATAAATQVGAVSAADGAIVGTVPAADTGDQVVANGQVVGTVPGSPDDVVVVGDAEPYPTAVDLLDRLLAAGGELVTLVTGTAAPPDLGDRLTGWLAAVHPEVEVSLYAGGQSAHLLLVGVE